MGSAYAAAAAREPPLRVTVVGAAGQIGYSLLPMIASGEMFGHGQRVILQCLDLNLPQVAESLSGLEMELHDGGFPLLEEVVCTVDDAKAFQDADYAILLGAFPTQADSDKNEVVEKNSMIFRTLGQAISDNANARCRVLVAGHPSCANALLCAYYTPALPKEHFFALSRLEQCRAEGQIARRARANAGEVGNVIVWGSAGTGGMPDFDNCLVKGKPLQSALHREMDKQWLEGGGFFEAVSQRGAAVHKARRSVCAMSAARAIMLHMRDLHCGTRPGQVVSMGVWSEENGYGLDPELFFSLPVACEGRGKFRIVKGLKVQGPQKEHIATVEKELRADRRLAQQFASKHGFAVEGASAN